MQLDQYQQAVVNADPKANLRVVGAPGSGKTRALVSRYSHLYLRCGFNPSRILVLTFSKKAAKEMSKRIILNVDISRQAKSNISTINAFCYRLYNTWRVGNKLKPLKVWQYGDKVTNPLYVASDLLQKHLATSDMSIFDSINKTLKSHPEPLPYHLEEIELVGPKAKSAYKAWQEYEIWMKENNLTDFYGQVWNVDRLMDKNKIFAMMIGQQFDKIIADEVQDMFPQTYRIILKLAEQSSIEIFADPSQSIYGFNGAAPHYINKLDMMIPNLESHHLTNNYRSESKIVQVVNDFGPATSSDFSPMNCVKSDLPGNVSIGEVLTIPDQADYIAKQIELNEYDYNDIYVLARTNGQCSALYQRLIELGIPSYYAGNFTIWDKGHMKAGIGYAAIIKGQDGPDDLLNVLNVPSEDHKNVFGNTASSYVPTRFLPKNVFTGKTFKAVLEGIIKPTRAQRPGVSNMLKFIDHLRGLDNDRSRAADINAAISKWVQWSGNDYMAAEDDLAMLWDKLENLDYNVDSLRIYIQKMQEARRKVKSGLNRVQIMTIHQAKGLEALVIFLTGLSEPVKGSHRDTGFHPGRNTNELVNEESCLYYTGISRAIRHLYLTYYLKSGETNYELSSFVTQFAKGIANGQV